MKTVTIITPTYNRAELLKNLYQSLEQQNNKDFEWLIVDDGSTDCTQEVVETYCTKCWHKDNTYRTNDDCR